MTVEAGNTPYYQRKIKCPGHYMIPPTVDVWLRKPVELLKNCSDFVEVKGERRKIKKEAIVHDKWGRKMLDWKKIYKLEKAGIVHQPVVTAAWAVEHVYDPLSVLCNNCPKYCKEGQGRVLTSTIRRLNGLPMKNRG